MKHSLTPLAGNISLLRFVTHIMTFSQNPHHMTILEEPEGKFKCSKNKNGQAECEFLLGLFQCTVGLYLYIFGQGPFTMALMSI